MAHNLATIDGRVAMAYQGETPWHRLGKYQEAITSVQQGLEAGNLDWQVELQPIALPSGRLISRRFAVVRTLDDQPLGIVGSDYEPIQNSEAFGVLSEAMEQYGVTIETAGALGRGERCWMLAKMPERVEPVAGDYVDGYFLVMVGHDGLTPYTGRLTPVRAVCQNTIQLALQGNPDAVVRLTHKKDRSMELEQVGVLVTTLTGALRKSGETFAQLAGRKMSQGEIDDYIDAVLGIPKGTEAEGALAKKRGRVLELVQGGTGSDFAPETAWAAFNAVTEYVDHIRTPTTNARMIKAKDENALFGLGAQLKARALTLAQQLVAA